MRTVPASTLFCPRAWHPPLILSFTHEAVQSPRQRHVFRAEVGAARRSGGSFSAVCGLAGAGVSRARALPGGFRRRQRRRRGRVRRRVDAAVAGATGMLAAAHDGARQNFPLRVTSATSSSAHRQATTQSLTSAGAVIAQASAPPPSPPDDRPGDGDGGSTPPAGNEARLTPDNEIIGVCRFGAPSTITIALAGTDRRGEAGALRWHVAEVAWFANYVGKLPADQFDLIMDLLLDKDKGIGLNLACYLIGSSPNGPYDWTADGRQRRTMLAALARNVDEVEAVSYSQPCHLTRRKLPTKVAGFDSFVGATLQYTFKFPAALKAGLFRLNVHGYINPPPSTADTQQYMEGVMVSMHRMATGLGKEVWVSEVGPMWVSGNDFGVMLFTARQIVETVNIMGASAWIFWQAVSGVGGNNPDAFLKWGLLAVRIYRLNDTEVKPLDLVISKKLYMLQQFVRGAPRGSLPLRIHTSDGCQHCIAAFFHPDQHFVSIFHRQPARHNTHSDIFIRGFVPFDAGQECVLETYRTSATENNTLVADSKLHRRASFDTGGGAGQLDDFCGAAECGPRVRMCCLQGWCILHRSA
ncbi:unnamed protein product [Closterium sp. NIES-64]|nr:unnamed protein product [Closterium sp. NIES-64]